MNLNIIIACDPLGTIGKNGKLPWDTIPGELKRFRDITMGHVMLMGGRTFESLPMFPNGFPGRDNVVLSNSLRKAKDISDRLNTLDSHIQTFGDVKILSSSIATTTTGIIHWLGNTYPDREVFVCGGSAVVQSLLPHADAIFLTMVHQIYAGDVRIPELPKILFDVLKTQLPSDPKPEWFIASKEEFDDYTSYKIIKRT